MVWLWEVEKRLKIVSPIEYIYIYILEYRVMEGGQMKNMEEGDITAESGNHMVSKTLMKKITVVFLAIIIPFLLITYISSGHQFQDFLFGYSFYSPLNRRSQGNQYSSPNLYSNTSSPTNTFVSSSVRFSSFLLRI